MASVAQAKSCCSSDFIPIYMEESCGSQSFSSVDTEEEQLSDSSDEEQNNNCLSPKHPIPELQGPFEESICESLPNTSKDWIVDLDAQSRRRDLLEGPRYERLCGRKWRQRTDERYHPFWKLIAQMSFGVHLLVKGTAKSSIAVLNILQAHVDEMDGFVSRTSEDFLIIQVDLRTRIQYLSLPLENLDLFDEMLGDRNFRLAMIDYNDKIERAIERFSLAINDALKDIQKGKEAISGLWQYLGRPSKDNTPLSGNLAAIYDSMLANTEGWNLALSKLRKKGTALLYAITQLGRAIIEMQRRVGVASRRDVVSFVPPLPTTRAKSIRGFFDRGLSAYLPTPQYVQKPLPRDPALTEKLGAQHRTTFSSSGRLGHQKSVPNLGATRDHYATPHTFERAKSINGARLPSRGSDASSIIPRLQSTINRRLSRAKLTKVTVEEVLEETVARPSTSASRTLRPFRKGRYEEQPPLPQDAQTREKSSLISRPSIRSREPGTPHISAKGETMKNQLRQYFVSDRVLDAWESVRERDRRVGQFESRKDGLWSIFQAKSGTRSGELSEILCQNDIQTQMEWLEEETKHLNTYSLKPRQETGPKVHTISDNTSGQQGLDGEKSYYAGFNYLKALEADDSIITALPAFPLPPIGQIPHTSKVPAK